MNPTRFSLGLIGYPLEKSLSPVLHHAALHASHLAGEYHLYPIAPLPEGQNGLASMMEHLRKGELHGINVTIPHKQNVLPYLDELTPSAQAVGAANTLFIENDRLGGDNTDIPGFISDLKNQLPGRSGKALVLGAGGSARAIVFALLQTGWQVTVATRRLEQAQELAARFSKLGCIQTMATEANNLASLRKLDLLVNTTPVGMFPKPDGSPWPKGLPLPEGAAIYDLIYKPMETNLIRQARQEGHPAVNGLGMLVEQGALSFERWTGKPADRDEIWQAVRRELQNHNWG